MTTRNQADQFARAFQSQVARHPGAACLTLPILKDLGVADAVNALCPSGHVVSHGDIVTLLATNRLQAPRPLYKVAAWLAHTGLESALGVQAEEAHDTRLGDTLDALYPQHPAIWQQVVLQAVRRYRLPLAWLHYDLTSTYFEGAYSESELVEYGYSRDQRPDTKQLTLGLTVLAGGVPLAFRVLVGNTADKTTPRQNLEAVKALLQDAYQPQTTIVHDRGMVTVETLLWYEQQGQRYLTSVTTDAGVQAVLDGVAQQDLWAHPLAYRPKREGEDTPPGYYAVWREHTLEAEGRKAQVRALVVYSVSKARLDEQKRQAALTKLMARLGEIQSHLNQRKYKQRAYTWEQIHLAQRGNPAREFIDVRLEGEEGSLVLTYQVNAEKLAAAERRDGRYAVLTNCWELSADEAFAHLKAQDQVEKRIWVLKGPLQIHPLWLHKDERLVSLVLVLMIALLVYCLLEHLVRQAQRQLTGRAMLEAFGGYSVVLLRFGDSSQLWLYPDLTPLQADLLSALDFPAPQVTLMLS
jgi:transposase